MDNSPGKSRIEMPTINTDTVDKECELRQAQDNHGFICLASGGMSLTEMALEQEIPADVCAKCTVPEQLTIYSCLYHVVVKIQKDHEGLTAYLCRWNYKLWPSEKKERKVNSLMGVDKVFYKSLFKNLFSNPCLVEFWDGDMEQYGEGEVKFEIILREPIPKSEIMADPSLAFGEAYMHGKIEIEGSVRDVVESLYNNKDSFLHQNPAYLKLAKFIANNLKQSKENAQFHYDIGNDFYQLWLDETMTYSCAYFKSPSDTLAQAQKNKVDHILRKLNLRAGQHLLDIGCGWGELIITATQKYQVKALGITLSREQYDKVQERIDHENLNDLVNVQLLDYREIKNQTFDRVVSVGMLEHVGKEHLGKYFATVHRLLGDEGISLLHTITGREEAQTNSWIDKYIFPGGYIPTVSELIKYMEDYGFYLYDVESLRNHYTRTLEHWAENFEQALPLIRQNKDDTFIRMWRLYLNSAASSFHSGNIDLHQFLFSKGPNNRLPWTREYIYR